MKKYIYTALFLLISQISSFSQNYENTKRDSLKIDGLKKNLSVLRDTARINCLNNIAELYLNHAGYKPKVRTDSAFVYSSLANTEAKQIGYTYGDVLSLLTLTRSKQFVQQITASEKYIRQALTLTLKLNDDHLLARCYYLLAAVENMIENYKKAIYYFQKTGDVQQETEVTTWLCMAYSNQGMYEEGFQYCDKCIKLSQTNVKKDSSQWGHELVQWSFFNMYTLYKAAGDYETAMEYLYRNFQYANNSGSGWKMYSEMSELYCLMGKYDSALHYWGEWKKDWDSYAVGHRAYGNSVLAQIYLRTYQPDKALPLLKDAITTFRQKGREMGGALIRPLFFTGEVLSQKRNYPEALKYVKEALEFAEKNNLRPDMMNGYQQLSSIYHQLGKNESAYIYLLKYITIKDSIQNRQFLLRLYNYKRETENIKKESQISLLNKDNKIKEQQLKQQSAIKNFLIAIFIAFILVGLFVYRNLRLRRKNEILRRERAEDELKVQQLESEKKHSELLQQASELEMQALRAQMNPHFIFNCLSSINKFILKNETEAASDYLTRFSRLIRMVLINSQKSLITLEDELEMLRLYLDMERLRFKNSFEYNIHFKNTVDAGAIFLPPLLLQPFCENAIWHGLMHKEGQGVLDIAMTMQDNILNCTIADNGVGREKAAEYNSKSAEKEKSLGLKITASRLELLNRNNGAQTSYKIEDLYDEKGNAAGTKVTVQIRYKNSVEELV